LGRMKKIEAGPTLCTQPSFIVRVFLGPLYPYWLTILNGYHESAALFTHPANGGYPLHIGHLILFEGKIESAGSWGG
jgi:hypothetical protein